MEREFLHAGGMFFIPGDKPFFPNASFKPSRVDANFSVELFDWNQIEQAKSLGSARIELADLEPFQGVERTLHLISAKRGEKGVVRIRLLFHPEFISKTRKTTSTLSSATRTMTNIGAMPLGAGKGVIQGVAGVFKRDKNKDDDGLPPFQDVAAGQVSRPLPPSEPFPDTPPSALIENGTKIGTESGSLKVTVMDAKDLSWSDVKPYVVLRLGSVEHKTKHSGKTLTPEW
jgi:Ca2+-dependent lipid-binding protein